MANLKINGRIDAVSDYGIMINQTWYNCKDARLYSKDEQVLITYEIAEGKKGKYNKVIDISRQIKASGYEKEKDIHLQVCLKAAAQIYSGTKVNPEQIAEYALKLYELLWD